MTERIAYSQSEFCRAIGINRSTLWRWVQSGKIKLVEIGGMKFVPAAIIDALRVTPEALRGNKTVQIPGNTMQLTSRWETEISRADATLCNGMKRKSL